MNPACFPTASHGDMDRRIAAKGVMVSRGRGNIAPEHKVVIPGVLEKISELMGGDHYIRNLNIQIFEGGRPHSSHPCSSYAAGPFRIELVTSCSGRDSRHTLGHLVHEIGHTVAHRANVARSYSATPRCHVTNYARKFHAGVNWFARSEEFAEVFAMYLHSPNHLKNACPTTFDWLKNNIFRSGIDPTAKCSGSPNPIPMGGGQIVSGPGGNVSGNKLTLNNQLTQLAMLPLLMMAQQQMQAPAPASAPVYYGNQFAPSGAIREGGPVNPWPTAGPGTLNAPRPPGSLPVPPAGGRPPVHLPPGAPPPVGQPLPGGGGGGSPLPLPGGGGGSAPLPLPGGQPPPAGTPAPPAIPGGGGSGSGTVPL